MGQGSKERKKKLTRCLLHIPSAPLFVAPRGFADGFVAGRQRHDGEQGDDEGEGAGYAPAGEDDAEVGGVPGEEHLRIAITHISVSSVPLFFWWKRGLARGI